MNMTQDFETVPLGTTKRLQEQTLYKVSVWQYDHRHGTDVLCVLAPKHMQVEWHQVVIATNALWEGKLTPSEQAVNSDREVRYDERIEHVLDLPLTIEALRGTIPEVT
jgi:hypothetical protein